MFMKIKIRNPRVLDDRQVPFSIYMKFVKPRAVCGREVIWVDGQNNNNLVVHDTNPLVRAYHRLLVWDIDIARWSELACSRAGRTLTEAEWEEFLGDEPYDPFCV